MNGWNSKRIGNGCESGIMIVAIDGPAGAGKSTVSRMLAQRLGFRFLDTGAMYRAVAYAGLQHGIAWHDSAALVQLARQMKLELIDHRVLLNDVDVTTEIRTVKVAEHVHFPADNPEVRTWLVELQRQFANHYDTVTEGRDQGTVAFPHAEVKIFLTATPEVRAHRRHAELKARGEHLTFEEVLRMQNLRDLRDASRDVGRLEKARDAVEFFTDGLTFEQVVDQLEVIVRRRLRMSQRNLSGTA
jgi:CMP/dCMP kinase